MALELHYFLGCTPLSSMQNQDWRNDLALYAIRTPYNIVDVVVSVLSDWPVLTTPSRQYHPMAGSLGLCTPYIIVDVVVSVLFLPPLLASTIPWRGHWVALARAQGGRRVPRLPACTAGCFRRLGLQLRLECCNKAGRATPLRYLGTARYVKISTMLNIATFKIECGQT